MQIRGFTAALAATALLLATPLPALAHMQGQQHAQGESGSTMTPAPSTGMMMGSGTMGPGTTGTGMMQGMPQGMMPGMMPGTMPGGAQMPMMGGGGTGMGMGMMDCPMMAHMMRRHPGMMAMMHGGMGPGGGMMMGQGMRPGTMMGQGGTGMMMGQGAMDLGSGVVRPIQHLSVDDVTHFFQHRLEWIGNDRLKLGQVTQKDEDTIAVEIVTVDDSLLDRLEVDRHSGMIERAQ